jgi:hypothetical protein
MKLRVGIDIGGVLSKYPVRIKELIATLRRGGAEVFIITDMPEDTALRLLNKNNLAFLPVLCADWAKYQELCKTVLATEANLDIVIDDYAPYVAEGEFIGMTVSPKPRLQYDGPGWNT